MSGKNYLTNNTYFKRNVYEAIKYIVPDFYIEDDISNFDSAVDLQDSIINSHIDFANNISSLLFISSISDSVIFSSMDAIEGISPYFVKQNGLTDISPEDFERKILKRVNKSFYDFGTSAAFSDYLLTDLLSSIQCNYPASSFQQSWDWSSTQSYLIENLSWLYFLNTSGPSWAPSSFVHDTLVQKTYKGQTITLNDCLKGVSEFAWRNALTGYIPTEFLSGTSTYVSGDQPLNNYNTWIDVIYSPLFADNQDFIVRDRFQTFIDNTIKTETKIPNGPMSKLLRMMSFAYFDINNQNEQIKSLYDIEECPGEYLPLLADLIGWNLFGDNEERWRLQLKNAVEVYKRVGTKAGLQFALNSIFPKDIFLLESRVTELWESYIPYIIYYALATESHLFKDNTTWTREISNRMNVSSYSNSSIDDNIKLSVDRIVYETYLDFSSSFNIPNVNNEFFYRNRTYPIPPFEEYPYYVNVEATLEMIDFIVDRLVCFGVRSAFALQVRDYLIGNMLDSDDEVRNSSWLFFTSGYNEPPNLANIIPKLYEKKFEYVSLWSGKSSHFKLVFDAADFDFTVDDDYSPDTGDAVILASKVVNEFAPAHAIPLIHLQLSATDTVLYEYSSIPIAQYGISDFVNGGYNSNYEASALHVNSYQRNNTTGNKFGRRSLQSLQSDLLTGGTPIATIPRNSFRRRDYYNLMPKDGYYDRTGDNMPVSWSMASGLSGIPLGFIPSSLEFQSISSYSNLPDVYSQCYTLNSSASIYGYEVSNTLAARGQTKPGLMDPYVDRCQTPEIYALMHRVQEKAKVIEASAYVLLEASSLSAFDWKNVMGSYANSATEVSGWFPNSVEDYYEFGFGTDMHTYYKNYRSDFERHRMGKHLFNLDGPNIFAHTFGSVFRNSDFDTLGSFGSTYSTSSLSAIQYASNGEGQFTYSASIGIDEGIESLVLSSSYVQNVEFSVSSIVKGLQLIQTSGTSIANNFMIIKVPTIAANSNTSEYMLENRFIQQRSVDGLGRIRFGINTFTNPASEGHPIQTNFLLPEHEFSFTVKSLASNANGTRLGGSKLGIWVHTEAEDGKMWSYNTRGEWVQHSQVITKATLLDYYAYKFTYEDRDRLQEAKESRDLFKRLSCIEILSGTSEEVNPFLTFDESDFEEFTVSFNTNNKPILLPDDYLRARGNVHRKNQKYVIDFFKLPDNVNRSNFVLYDDVDLRDDTLNRLSKYLVSGTPKHDPLRPRFCPEWRVDLSKDDIHTLFKFWNTISGKNSKPGYASRDATTTSSLLYGSGGSRLDYRLATDWMTPSVFGLDPTVLEYILVEVLIMGM